MRVKYLEIVYTLLTPGQYVPLGSSAQGTWYLGPPDNVKRVYVESAKSRSDKKTFVVVHRGGLLIPHSLADTVELFYIPASEKYLLVDLPTWNTESSNATPSADTFTEVLTQAFSSPPTPQASNGVAVGVGAAIASVIIDFDRGGFKIMPKATDQHSELARRWLLDDA